MSIDRAVIVHVFYVQMKVWCIIYNVQYCGVLCVVQVVYGLGEKLFLCLVDLVLSALWRRPEVNRSKRDMLL